MNALDREVAISHMTADAEPLHAVSFSRNAPLWSRMASPLRPCDEDIELLVAMAAAPDHEASRLLLGVTPEIADRFTPADGMLNAVDVSAEMIRSVWVGDTTHRRAIIGNWLALPFATGSIDTVLADGILVLLPFPQGARRLAAELARVLRPGGHLAIRCFCRPPSAEALGDVLDAARSATIGSFHAFKWRLAMALQGDDPSVGVAVSDVWRCFEEAFPDREHLSRLTGWSGESISTIDVYRDNPARYAYPDEWAIAAAISGSLEHTETYRGNYELAERCPVLGFRRPEPP